MSTLIPPRPPAPVLERHRLRVLHANGYTDEWLASDGREKHLTKQWLAHGSGESALFSLWDRLAQQIADAEEEGRGERASYREALHRIVDRIDRCIEQELGPAPQTKSWAPPPLPSLGLPTGLQGAINQVYSFHDAMALPTRDEPGLPEEGRAQLRLDMACEELLELAAALGVDEGWIFQARNYLDQMEVRIGKRPNGDPNPVRAQLCDIADALIDKIYIDVGTLLEFGIPGDRVWRAVHQANMAKVGGPKRADGKQLKPEDWVPPDIERAVFGPEEETR